jgi:hypothetical protein
VKPRENPLELGAELCDQFTLSEEASRYTKYPEVEGPGTLIVNEHACRLDTLGADGIAFFLEQRFIHTSMESLHTSW